MFRRRRFFQGKDIRTVPGQLRDIAWFTPVGQEMTDADRQAGPANSLTVFLNGDAISEPDRRGEPVRSDSFLLLFNASELDLEFTLPPTRYGARWSKVLDTAVPLISAHDVGVVKPADVIIVPSRSVQVLCRRDRSATRNSRVPDETHRSWRIDHDAGPQRRTARHAGRPSRANPARGAPDPAPRGGAA